MTHLQSNFINTGKDYYCIAEVQAGKVYKVIINSDGRMIFRYAVLDSAHDKRYFLTKLLDNGRGTYTHILRPLNTGHLAVDSFKEGPGFWSNAFVQVEEVE